MDPLSMRMAHEILLKRCVTKTTSHWTWSLFVNTRKRKIQNERLLLDRYGLYRKQIHAAYTLTLDYKGMYANIRMGEVEVGDEVGDRKGK